MHRLLLAVGSQRSGTTRLNRMLNAHRDIALPYQQSNFLRLELDARKPLSIAEVRELLAKLRPRYAIYSDRLTEAVAAELIEAVGMRKAPPTVGQIYALLLERLMPKRGTLYIGEKYAGRSIDALKFLDIVPDGRVIQIVRDIRDVLASEKRRLIRAGGSACVAKQVHFISFFDWRIGNRIGDEIAALCPSNFLRIRYEDLVTAPAATLKCVCDFLELEFDPAIIEATKFTDDAGIPWTANSSFTDNVRELRRDFGGRWQQVLSGDEIAFLVRTCDEEMRRLGYSWREDGDEDWFGAQGSLRLQAQAAARSYLNETAYAAYSSARSELRFDFSALDNLYRCANDDARQRLTG